MQRANSLKRFCAIHQESNGKEVKLHTKLGSSENIQIRFLEFNWAYNRLTKSADKVDMPTVGVIESYLFKIKDSQRNAKSIQIESILQFEKCHY